MNQPAAEPNTFFVIIVWVSLALLGMMLISMSYGKLRNLWFVSRVLQGRWEYDRERDAPLVESLSSLAQWLALVNDRPDEAPHVSIFGPSGSGKTTLAHALLATRGGQVVVVDPKPALPGASKLTRSSLLSVPKYHAAWLR